MKANLKPPNKMANYPNYPTRPEAVEAIKKLMLTLYYQIGPVTDRPKYKARKVRGKSAYYIYAIA